MGIFEQNKLLLPNNFHFQGQDYMFSFKFAHKADFSLKVTGNIGQKCMKTLNFAQQVYIKYVMSVIKFYKLNATKCYDVSAWSPTD